VGVPVYNAEKYIRETLESIITQDYDDFQILISDNFSQDGTYEVCKEYKDRYPEKISLIRHNSNIGAFNNFKFLLESTNTAFFMWNAADDLMGDRKFISTLINAITSRNLDYAFPDVSIISAEGRPVRKNCMVMFAGDLSLYALARATLKINSYQIYGMFKTEVIRKNFIHLERTKHIISYGEASFVHASMMDATGGFVQTATRMYRIHDQNTSITASYFPKVRDFLVSIYYVNRIYLSSKKFSPIQKLFLIIELNAKNIFHLIDITILSLYKTLKKITSGFANL
jgi:glycosyltransferase involved in cell wall biosynthesis